MNLLQFTDKGIYCAAANVYIDPWRQVDKAIITHAHSDHARWGMKHYLCHHQSVNLIKTRLNENISIEGKNYNESFNINGVKFSLHPAGHIIGSAQVRVEYAGEVWVVSGDYKTEADGTCVPFEPVRCNTFITECTFGLPVYNWKPQAEIINDINSWWQENNAAGVNSVIFAYSLGKAQRIICNVNHSIGKIFTHGAVENMNKALRETGIVIPETIGITKDTDIKQIKGALIVAPPSADDSPWLKKFQPYKTAIASGWMALRGARRRRNVDRGFVMSDHADWKGLNEAVNATGCENVIATHGYTEIFTRWLCEQGYHAITEKTQFEGELIEGNDTE